MGDGVNSANRQKFEEFFNKHDPYFIKKDIVSSAQPPHSRVTLGQNKTSFVKQVMKEKGQRRATIGVSSEAKAKELSGEQMIHKLKSPGARNELPEISLRKRVSSQAGLGSGEHVLASSVNLQAMSPPRSNLKLMSEIDEFMLKSQDEHRKYASLSKSRPTPNLSSLSRQQQIVFPGQMAIPRKTPVQYYSQLTNYSELKDKTVKQQAEISKMRAAYGVKRKSTQDRSSFDSYRVISQTGADTELASQRRLNDITVATPVYKPTEDTSVNAPSIEGPDESREENLNLEFGRKQEEQQV